MRLITTLITAALLILNSQAGAESEEHANALWKSGNDFLRVCDERSSYRMGFSAQTNQMLEDICLAWIVGLNQAMVLEDQMRPEKTQTKAEETWNRESLETLAKIGVKPSSVSVTKKNACVPEDVTHNQLKLAIMKFMRDNPKALNMHAAWLAIAAIKTEWPCER